MKRIGKHKISMGVESLYTCHRTIGIGFHRGEALSPEKRNVMPTVYSFYIELWTRVFKVTLIKEKKTND